MIIKSNNLQEIRYTIQKLKKDNPDEEIIVRAIDFESNRKILEIKGVDVLLSPELHNRKDKLKERDSGMNEFLFKLARKNNIKIGIDMDEIRKLDKRNKAIVLSRVRLNIKLAKKANAILVFYPESTNKNDLLSFVTTMKGSTEQVKK